MNTNNKCPYGEQLWVLPNDKERGSTEYIEGSFPRFYCNPQCTWCTFSDYHECALYEKKEKE